MRLREAGGRTIERSITLPVNLGEPTHRHQVRCSRPSSLGEGEKASFDVVLLDADGKPRPPLTSTGSSCASTPRGSGTAATARGPTKPDHHAQGRATASVDATAGRARQDLGRRRLRPLSPRGRAPPTPAASLSSVDLQRRLVHERRDGREPRDARRRPRQGHLSSRATRPSCASPPSRAARRS